MSIPISKSDVVEYPVFRRIRLSDRDIIERFLSQFEPYCDFRFWAMWHRDIEEIWEISSLFDHLLIKFVDHVSGNTLYTIIGANEKTSEVIIAMLSFLSKNTLYPKLTMVPQETVNAITQEFIEFFKISLDRNNIDYVYSTKQLTDLKGNKMKNKRHEISRYWNNYPASTIRLLDLHSESDVSMIASLTHKWASMRKAKNHEREVNTMTRLLGTRENRDHLHAVGLFMKSKLIGFTINEPFNNQWYSGYFGKADPTYRGAFSVLENETAKFYYGKGFEYANLEQDLGIPGLKKTKQLWRPLRMLNKYTVMPRWSSGVENIQAWNRYPHEKVSLSICI